MKKERRTFIYNVTIHAREGAICFPDFNGLQLHVIGICTERAESNQVPKL